MFKKNNAFIPKASSNLIATRGVTFLLPLMISLNTVGEMPISFATSFLESLRKKISSSSAIPGWKMFVGVISFAFFICSEYKIGISFNNPAIHWDRHSMFLKYAMSGAPEGIKNTVLNE